MLDFLCNLISIRSLSGEEGPAIERCVEEMRSLGFDVEVDAAGNAVGYLDAGGPLLLFDGHIDTVAAGDGWSEDAFTPRVTDAAVFGRGSVDMKGPVAAMIHGVATAARAGRLGGSVVVSVSTLEETLEGAALRAVIDRLNPAAVVIAEPSGGTLMLAQKGRAEILLDVHGRIAHAAFPEQGANALSATAAVLAALEARADPVDEELGRGILIPTEAFTTPRPGVSIVPPRCRVRLDRRLLPGETEQSVLAELEPFLEHARRHGCRAEAGITNDPLTTYTGAEVVECRRFLPAWRTPANSAIAGWAHTALGDPPIGAWHFCTNGSLTAGMLGIPTIGYGPGATASAHQPDEHIMIAELEEGRDAFARLAAAPVPHP